MKENKKNGVMVGWENPPLEEMCVSSEEESLFKTANFPLESEEGQIEAIKALQDKVGEFTKNPLSSKTYIAAIFEFLLSFSFFSTTWETARNTYGGSRKTQRKEHGRWKGFRDTPRIQRVVAYFLSFQVTEFS